MRACKTRSLAAVRTQPSQRVRTFEDSSVADFSVHHMHVDNSARRTAVHLQMAGHGTHRPNGCAEPRARRVMSARRGDSTTEPLDAPEPEGSSPPAIGAPQACPYYLKLPIPVFLTVMDSSMKQDRELPDAGKVDGHRTG